MSKDKLTDYDATASNNTDVGGISVAEGMLPSAVNNAIREQMSHQKEAFGLGTPLYVDQTNNRLGIGETSPSSELHVKGGAGANIAVQSTAGSHWRLGDAVGSSNGIFVIRDHTNSANRVQILADGKTQIAQGVTFGTDTAAANTLDDYEEGTWTPQIWKNTTQVTSPTATAGQYRKIGDVIFYSFYFYKSSGSNTDSNAWELRGMPFAMETGSTSGYTCLTAGYTGINSVNYFNQAGSHRWQNNYSSRFELYGPQQTTQWTSGHIEFAGYGFVYQA